MTFFKEVQLLKVPANSLLTLKGISISSSDEQYLKTSFPKKFKLEGKSIFFSDLQSEKHSSSITLTLSEIMIFLYIGI